MSNSVVEIKDRAGKVKPTDFPVPRPENPQIGARFSSISLRRTKDSSETATYSLRTRYS